MATATTTSSANGRATALIRSTALTNRELSGGVLKVLPAWIISGVVHAILCLIFLVLILTAPSADASVVSNPENGIVDDPAEQKPDLTEPAAGIVPGMPPGYDVPLIASVDVPGKVDPDGAIGIVGGQEVPPSNIPPPPGIGRGQGGAILDPSKIGTGSPIGQPGGYLGGLYTPGGFGDRVGGGATRERRAIEGGGSKASEAAVGLGLEWLSIHQSSNGSWSLDKFHQHAHEKGVGPTGKEFRCDCGGQGQTNEIAATAFGMLPFLGAGVTHQPPKDKPAVDYHKTVRGAIDFLLSKEKSDGDFGGGMYAQGLATIALCEAYGLTADAKLKEPAQRAINYIKNAQHEAGGGWRYKPKEPGDTSVVGWQVMALKSAQMSGLSVPKETLDGATKFLNSVMTSDGSGYGYTNAGAAPTTTAVGLLCRMYLGWTYRNPLLLKGVDTLKSKPPGALDSMYYYYYATQLMHHMGGEYWETWNPKMRDTLIEKQDKGNDPKHAHQKGSWSPAGDAHGPQGGRLMQTSLSVLTLEVYYRHLPLYRRDLNTMKEMEAKP